MPSIPRKSSKARDQLDAAAAYLLALMREWGLAAVTVCDCGRVDSAGAFGARTLAECEGCEVHMTARRSCRCGFCDKETKKRARWHRLGGEKAYAKELRQSVLDTIRHRCPKEAA